MVLRMVTKLFGAPMPARGRFRGVLGESARAKASLIRLVEARARVSIYLIHPNVGASTWGWKSLALSLSLTRYRRCSPDSANNLRPAWRGLSK